MRLRAMCGAMALTLAVSLGGCATLPSEAGPTASKAPLSEDEQVQDLLSRMSIERKVAQLIQPQINSFTAEDMERYRFGSYLNGGDGGPYDDELAPASEWLRLADEMWVASTRPLPGNEPAIPTMWGTDAVHGHTNVVQATIFPHNIGLGATHDPDLVRRIGAATAIEIEATGIDWNFSPTVAVARDDRWGRTYESYSEDPQLVARLGAALIEGLQGQKGTPDFLSDGKVIATAKHFFGDGGTAQGIDTGDVNGDIEALKAIHAVPYPAAIAAGVQVVMASFNSINGVKMHGNKQLLTDYLRGDLGFDGLVVGDWNGHGQIKGCTVTNCPQALLAGLDIYMVPEDWKPLLESLVAQVKDGTIPKESLDAAVGRVLRVKMRAGILGPNSTKPSARPNAGEFAKLGSETHRAIAREAVAKSQVILKNNGVLPLKDGSSILVAGSAADSIVRASGGWTLSWQGSEDIAGKAFTRVDFPGATSIWEGIKEAAQEANGTAVLSPDGSFTHKPDVAIVVFGEKPYAEFSGDLKTMVFADEEGLDLLRKLKTQGIPTVAVFLSGRPMWMNREINASSAFVASWLPGSEGAGVADILFGKRDATGRLSFSWPADCGGKPVNSPEGALFPIGYGLSLSEVDPRGELAEACGYLNHKPSAVWYELGRLSQGITAKAGDTDLPGLRGTGGGIVSRGIDKDRQADAREITFDPGASLTLTQDGVSNGDFRILYDLADAPTGSVTISAGATSIDVTRQLQLGAGKGWREMVLTSSCLADLGGSLSITSYGPLKLQVASITRQELPQGTECSF